MRARLTGSSEGTLDEYVMIDSTHVITTSNLLDINAPGYNLAKNFDEQDRIVLEGWLMANFLAMIAYYKLYRKLVEAKKLNNYSPKDIVEISKSISSININGQWHTTEITKKTKDLFKKLKIDYLTERS